MPASDAWIGKGAILKIGDGTSNESFTAVATLKEANFPERSRSVIDTTTQDATNAYMTRVGGFIDPGSVSATFVADKTGYLQLVALFEASGNTNMQLIMPDTPASQLDFTGFVSEFGGRLPYNDAGEFSMTITISGAVSFTS